MARKDDRRIQRTRKALRDALHALVLDRGYDDLSVQDITDKANLGRATFYLHYREKDELLEDLLREFSKDFTQRQPNKIHFSDQKTLQSVFEFAENYYDFYRIMTIGKGGIIGMHKLQTIIRETYAQYLDEIETTTGGKLIVPRPFLENYFANSLLSSVCLWLEQEMPYTPAEMADMLLKVASPERMAFSPSSEELPNERPNSKNKKDKTAKPAEGKPAEAEILPQIATEESLILAETEKTESSEL